MWILWGEFIGVSQSWKVRSAVSGTTSLTSQLLLIVLLTLDHSWNTSTDNPPGFIIRTLFLLFDKILDEMGLCCMLHLNQIGPHAAVALETIWPNNSTLIFWINSCSNYLCIYKQWGPQFVGAAVIGAMCFAKLTKQTSYLGILFTFMRISSDFEVKLSKLVAWNKPKDCYIKAQPLLLKVLHTTQS